jgi:hypothetical protein
MVVVLQGAGASAPTVSFCTHIGVSATRQGVGLYTVQLPTCARAVCVGSMLQDSSYVAANPHVVNSVSAPDGIAGTHAIRGIKVDGTAAVAELAATQTLTLEYRLYGVA